MTVTTITNGELSNYKKADEVKDTLADGRVLAEQYARENLADNTAVKSLTSDWKDITATDGWSISKNDADKKVSGTVELKYKIVDGKNDVYGPLYYVVNLKEKIRHFFMPGWFDDMVAPVRAVVLLQPNERGLITPMQRLERTMVVDNWEYAKQYLGSSSVYAGKWNHYMAGTTSDDTGIKYSSGNVYRTESINVRPVARNGNNKSDGQSTAANGGKFYNVNEVDSINFDFQAEVSKKFSTDWDLGQPLSDYSYSHVEKINGEKSWGVGNGDDKRILFNVEFNEAFAKRPSVSGTDPLWTRIESDPIKNPYTGAGVNNFNTVRQITLNFNSNNALIDNDGNYKYRPYVIFYTGPENIDYTTDENGVLKRHSQPVVINLNDDTNAIIYMPNSSVIINGNGHKLSGFVIAKCYLFSVTEEDMTNGKFFEHYDGFNASEIMHGNFSKGTDGSGYTVYFDSEVSATLKTKEELNNLYKGEEFTTLEDGSTGNLTVKEKIKAPQYPVISFTKDLYTNCKTLEEYFAITANYINTTYTKEKYMQYSGLSEDKVSMIKFPEENEVLRNASGIIANPNTAGLNYGNFTAVTIPVATADLLDADPDPDALTKDNKYVKVMLGNEEKYIAKSKLPHIRVKWNSNFPYVCLYDLKTGLGWGMEQPFICVKPMDDTTSTADSAIVFTNSKDKNVAGSNQWGDVWVIERRILEDVYNSQYKADKLEFATENGMKYFMLKTDITKLAEPQVIAKYKKVVVELETGVETVKYIREDDADIQYYTKVENNKDDKGNTINYIITDKNGNILTKTLTPPEVFNVDNVDSNNALEKKINSLFGKATDKDLRDYYNVYTREPNSDEQPGDPGKIVDGRYVYNDVNHETLDYRIPALERVYKKSTFNLKEYDGSKSEKYDIRKDSFYSYFGIKDLYRINYTYLNRNELEYSEGKKYPSADMFFTEKRSEWID